MKSDLPWKRSWMMNSYHVIKFLFIPLEISRLSNQPFETFCYYSQNAFENTQNREKMPIRKIRITIEWRSNRLWQKLQNLITNTKMDPKMIAGLSMNQWWWCLRCRVFISLNQSGRMSTKFWSCEIFKSTRWYNELKQAVSIVLYALCEVKIG